MTNYTELVDALKDLYVQATTERSHYYTGEVIRRAMNALEAQGRELDEQIELGTALAKALEQDRARLAEAEALLRETRCFMIPGMGWTDSVGTLIKRRIDTFLTPPPEVKS